MSHRESVLYSRQPHSGKQEKEWGRGGARFPMLPFRAHYQQPHFLPQVVELLLPPNSTTCWKTTATPRVDQERCVSISWIQLSKSALRCKPCICQGSSNKSKKKKTIFSHVLWASFLTSKSLLSSQVTYHPKLYLSLRRQSPAFILCCVTCWKVCEAPNNKLEEEVYTWFIHSVT